MEYLTGWIADSASEKHVGILRRQSLNDVKFVPLLQMVTLLEDIKVKYVEEQWTNDTRSKNGWTMQGIYTRRMEKCKHCTYCCFTVTDTGVLMEADDAGQKSHYPPSIMLATSANVLYPGHNHLLTTSTDDSLVLER